MAVMATVLTMSSTVVPRERSLTGLFRPCNTGPTATAPADCCTALYVLLPVLRSGKINRWHARPLLIRASWRPPPMPRRRHHIAVAHRLSARAGYPVRVRWLLGLCPHRHRYRIHRWNTTALPPAGILRIVRRFWLRRRQYRPTVRHPGWY